MQENIGETVYQFYKQDFYSIRDWCLTQKILFEDPYFKLDEKYEWKRPWELTDEPRLFVDGPSRLDVIQGDLGNCWMLAAISTLGMQPALVRIVVPDDQNFTSQYAGVFHFTIWQFGKWFDVVIDDLLPTLDGELAFLSSGHDNEFWSPLLEKAYCKILGGDYTVAEGGNLCEALEDFTGGIVEQFKLSSVLRNFQDILFKAVRRHSLIGCFISDLPGSYQSTTPEGLIRGHSYSVTGARKVNLPSHGNVALVRVRNPWGKFEWTGPWSDSSPEWRSIPQSTKRDFGLVYENDGEFWMSFSDFMTHFEWVDMCHLSPTSFTNVKASTPQSWQLNVTRGSWVKGVTAGGARAMHMNPHIRMSLSDADDDNNDGLCSVLIALMQRPKKGRGRLVYNEIGFKVYSLDPSYGDTTLDPYFFRRSASVVQVPLKRVREVAGRFNLLPGDYCVIPFTYEAGKDSDYMLRIYSEKSSRMDTMDQRLGLSPMDVRVSDTPPIKISAEKENTNDENVREFFEQMTGGDMQADWRELKNILEYTAENDKKNASKEKFGFHVFVDAATFVYDKVFGSKQKNAFDTIDEGIPKDVCRSMIALLDEDHSGKVGFDEFQVLWSNIQKWKSIYEIHGKDNKGYLNSSELRPALDSAGFRLNNRILGDLVHRYADKDGRISFDDFLHCVVKLKSMTVFYKTRDKVDSNKVEFTLDEFLRKTMYS